MDTQKNSNLKERIGIYLLGFFSLSLQTMMVLIIPLYAVSLNASSLSIGIAVSAFSILPLFLAVKSGSLIDRFGSGRIIRICAVLTMILTVMHPLIPVMAVIIVLQLLIGQVIVMVWIASQTLITRINNKRENRRDVAIFSFMAGLGTFVGPIATGFFWEIGGAWGGFLTLFFWTLCIFFSTLLIDQEPSGASASKESSAKKASQGAFRQSLRLMAIPAIVMVMFGTFLRLTSYNMRGAFYLVYLEEISLSVMKISLLFSLFSLISSVSPFCMNLLMRRIDAKKLLFVSGFFSILPLTLTPLFQDFWHFFILAVISGFFMGLTLPILLSLLSNTVDSEVQGTAIGLREMSNRAASVFIPFLFGVIVDQFGLEISFFVVGGIFLMLIVLVAPLLLMFDRQYAKRRSALNNQ